MSRRSGPGPSLVVPLLPLGLLLLTPLVKAARPTATEGRFDPPIPPSADALAEDAVAPGEIPEMAELPAARMELRLTPVPDARLAAVISDQAPQLRRCYQEALLRLPDLHGEMQVDIEVGELGLQEAGVRVDGTGDWRLVRCVDDALASWVAPALDDGRPGAQRLELSLALQPG